MYTIIRTLSFPERGFFPLLQIYNGTKQSPNPSLDNANPARAIYLYIFSFLAFFASFSLFSRRTILPLLPQREKEKNVRRATSKNNSIFSCEYNFAFNLFSLIPASFQPLLFLIFFSTFSIEA